MENSEEIIEPVFTKKTEIPEEYKKAIEAIKSSSYEWNRFGLPEHTNAQLKNYDRFLIATGLVFPDLQSENDERMYLSVKQILVDKKSGEVFSTIGSTTWEINRDHTTPLRKINDFNSPALIDQNTFDENGKIVNTEKVAIHVPTVSYYKQLLKDGLKTLPEIVNDALGIYADTFRDALNKL